MADSTLPLFPLPDECMGSETMLLPDRWTDACAAGSCASADVQGCAVMSPRPAKTAAAVGLATPVPLPPVDSFFSADPWAGNDDRSELEFSAHSPGNSTMPDPDFHVELAPITPPLFSLPLGRTESLPVLAPPAADAAPAPAAVPEPEPAATVAPPEQPKPRRAEAEPLEAAARIIAPALKGAAGRAAAAAAPRRAVPQSTAAAAGAGGRKKSGRSAQTCDVCGKTFSCQWSRNRHMNVHYDVRTYKCDYPSCQKVFREKHTLDRHIQACHLKQRPYACTNPGCSYRSSGNSNLRRHQQTCQHQIGAPLQKTGRRQRKAGAQQQQQQLQQLPPHGVSSLGIALPGAA